MDEYKSNSIAENILELYDLTADGKVVSAAKWVALWELVISRVNNIDTFCITIDEIATAWKKSEAALETTIAAFNAKYETLRKSFIHYGNTPPTDEHTRIWVQPVESNDGFFVTQAEFKEAVYPNYNNTTLTVDLTEASTWTSSSKYSIISLHALQNIDTIKVKYGAGHILQGINERVIPAGANINIVYTCKTQNNGNTPFEVEARVIIDTPWLDIPAPPYYGGGTTVQRGELIINYVTANSSPTMKFYEYNNTTINGTVVSQNADFAEVAEWADGNPNNEDRTGYFVCANVPVDNIVMKKATSVDDVKGVTIKNPAFAGNFTADKLDANGNLLPQYSFVAVIGFVPVRDNGSCKVGGRCMPDDNGCAVPSDNDMGYQVVNRVDANRVLIIIEPNGDMVQRIKSDMTEMQSELDKLKVLLEGADDALDRVIEIQNSLLGGGS